MNCAADGCKVRKVLFLCTGNYYRSRFAEEWFNHLVSGKNAGWVANSAGLRVVGSEKYNHGPISIHTREGLAARGIILTEPIRLQKQVTEEDFREADLVIALKEAEHRAMMLEQFPAWANKITYWHIHDLDLAQPAAALQEIVDLVGELVSKLTK